MTAHADTFVRDRLPPREHWPEFLFELPELRYPERLNCVTALLDDALTEGHAASTAIIGPERRWSYRELAERTDRIAHVLLADLKLIPGNRVLLRGPNDAMMIACWLAVVKAGGIAVTTMPMLRGAELETIARKAQIDLAICERRLAREVDEVAASTGLLSRRLCYGSGDLEQRMARHSRPFDCCETASDDVALLAFTSGTSGDPKATVHFHRDVLAMTDVVARHLLHTRPGDIYTGSPPLGFTFGLGALLAFPLRFRAATAPLEAVSPEALLSAIARTGATCLFTAPTAYRAMLPLLAKYDHSTLRQCVSAGEHLPRSLWQAWFERTGIRIIDGLGSTEMMHIFISAAGESVRPGATGVALPGYRACILDGHGNPVAPGTAGRLAVKGPTGCRYLDDARQRNYVQNGWNLTGDTYLMDEDGYFWYQAREDDMIISAGYNISPVDVELALVQHPAVLECGVVAAPDSERGHIVKAYVVLRDSHVPGPQLAASLQAFVKQRIAPYKYPRAIEFVEALPKTPTGKVQRAVLRARAAAGSEHPPSSS